MKNLLSKECLNAVETAQQMIKEALQENRYYENEPGREALKICPDLFSEISAGMKTVMITGTNGKTTTARMVTSILDAAGIKYIANREGANMAMRMATLFCENYDLQTGPKKKYAVLECDEAYLRRVMPQINPVILVITNIFPDQKDRFGSEEHVADLIYEAMEKSVPATCVISSDCHFKEKFMQLKDWGFIEYTSGPDEISIAGKSYPLHLQIPGEFNVKNAAGAACCGEFLGLSDETVLEGLKDTKPAFGRFETFLCKNHPVTICLVKNAAGYEAVSDWILKEDRERLSETSLILAMNNETGDGHDTGWLWENDYGKDIPLFKEAKIAGRCVKELGKILERENISLPPISIEEIPHFAKDQAQRTLIIANYTAMMEVRESFCQRGMLADYWEV